LVDTNYDLAKKLSSQFMVGEPVSEIQSIIGKVDAAIIALPHKLHHPITVELLKKGLHVLVEKPMALTFAGTQNMINTAHEAGKLLAIGHFWRYQPEFKLVKRVIDEEWLGKVVSFEGEEGIIFSSPIASPAMFVKEMGGGGALADMGPHMLDILVWWFGDYLDVKYWDDASGGVDANCKMNLVFHNGISGKAKFSRMRSLENQIKIVFENGVLEVPISYDGNAKMLLNDSDIAVHLHSTTKTSKREANWPNFMKMELENFARSVMGKEKYEVDAQEASISVRLIEDCYANRNYYQPY
tara:strand:- start:600 stop:1493 length:894 start_codon:yes stop_codon:yes gene_type:complete